MNIVTTTSVFPPCWDTDNLLIRLHNANFTHLDLAFDYCVQNPTYPFMTDAYERWALELKEKADALGLIFSHAHAPFNADARGVSVEKTLRCASLLGIKYLVVHPLYKNKDGKNYEKEEFLSVNVDAIRPILATAEKYGVILLTENLLWGESIKLPVISELVARVNSPFFGWCYDTGHGHAEGESLEALLLCKHAPRSLHIHDNHGSHRDEHLIPGDGTLDFDRCFALLKQIGYTGEFVLEAHHQSLDAHDVERDAILKRIYRRAEYWRDQFLTL